MLEETDRLSLILFNSIPTVLSNLKTMTPENKIIFKVIINEIYLSGSTDIAKGMEKAFSILKKENKQILSHLSSCSQMVKIIMLI